MSFRSTGPTTTTSHHQVVIAELLCRRVPGPAMLAPEPVLADDDRRSGCDGEEGQEDQAGHEEEEEEEDQEDEAEDDAVHPPQVEDVEEELRLACLPLSGAAASQPLYKPAFLCRSPRTQFQIDTDEIVPCEGAPPGLCEAAGGGSRC